MEVMRNVVIVILKVTPEGEIQNLSASQSSLIEVNSDGSDGSKQGEDVVTPDQSCSLAMSQCSIV